MFKLIRSLEIVYTISNNSPREIIKNSYVTSCKVCDEYKFIRTHKSAYWYLTDKYQGFSIIGNEVFYISNKDNLMLSKNVSNIIINNKNYTDDELLYILGNKYMDVNFISIMDGDTVLELIGKEHGL